MTNIIGYDSWKTDYPSHYDCEDAVHTCEGCAESITELEASEVGFCEDCFCDETEDTECDGCFYCLCCSDYDERKANGTLRVD